MKLRIKELREEMHYTQKEIADKVGSSQRNVCNWENGSHEPDCETLVKLADLFFVSLDELFGRESGFGFKVANDRALSDAMRAVSKLTDEQKITLSSFLTTVTK